MNHKKLGNLVTVLLIIVLDGAIVWGWWNLFNDPNPVTRTTVSIFTLMMSFFTILGTFMNWLVYQGSIADD